MSRFKNQVHKEELEEVSLLKKATTSHFNYWFGLISEFEVFGEPRGVVSEEKEPSIALCQRLFILL